MAAQSARRTDLLEELFASGDFVAHGLIGFAKAFRKRNTLLQHIDGLSGDVLLWTGEEGYGASVTTALVNGGAQLS